MPILHDHFETLYAHTEEVACDGGKGELGHPRVFLDLSKKNEVTCPYCSRHYVYKAESNAA